MSHNNSSTTKESVTVHMFLVRHGETTANRDGILQGHCDYPLTDNGINQLTSTGIHLKNVCFDMCITSDLRRAKHSAEIIVEQLHTKINSHHAKEMYNLREIGFGVREALPKHFTVDEAKEDVAKARGITKELVVDTAETSSDVSKRQMLMLEELGELIQGVIPSESTSHKSRNVNVLVVSHGGYIRAFLSNQCDVKHIPVAAGTSKDSISSIGNGSISIAQCTYHLASVGNTCKMKLGNKCCSAMTEYVNMTPDTFPSLYDQYSTRFL